MRPDLARVAAGAAAHSDHGRCVAEVFMSAARKETDAYKIKDVNKLLAIAPHFGVDVTVVEMLDGLMAGADPDIVKPYQTRIKRRYEAIWLETRVTAVEAFPEGLKVSFEVLRLGESQGRVTLGMPGALIRISLSTCWG